MPITNPMPMAATQLMHRVFYLVGGSEESHEGTIERHGGMVGAACQKLLQGSFTTKEELGIKVIILHDTLYAMLLGQWLKKVTQHQHHKRDTHQSRVSLIYSEKVCLQPTVMV